MYRSFVSSAALAAGFWACAQSQVVHQVFALSEGYNDSFGGGGQLIPVTLGVFDPIQGAFTTVATIEGPRFGSDVLVSNGSVFVAADDRVLRYDADSYAELAMMPVQGVRKLAVWNELLLLTRGELGGLPHYFEARDRSTLELLWTIDPLDGLTMSAEGIIVDGDKAYLAVSNAFDWSALDGKVGIISLPDQSYSEIDLGPDGLNPERLFMKDGDVLAFCNTDFSRSTISRVSTSVAPAVEYTVTVANNSGCATSALVEAEDKVYFLEYAQGELARFDVVTATVSDTLSGSPAVYGLIEDPINGVLYASTTDFSSSGELIVISVDGAVLSVTPAAISIGNMALDIRLSTNVREQDRTKVTVFPNPAEQELFVAGLNDGQLVEVLDGLGRVALRETMGTGAQHRIGLGSLAPGVYTLRAGGVTAVRFTKR